MTFSSLISEIVPHHNKLGYRNGRTVKRIIQHHWAGIGGGDARLLSPTEQASVTYIIYSDGTIKGQVPEEYRPWTSGSDVDLDAITFEVQNTGGQVNNDDSDPSSWPISDAAYAAIIRLIVDIAARHGWGSITPDNYQGHRQHYATACPGGYLWNRMKQTRALASAKLSRTTIEEDELSLADVAALRADLFHVFDRLKAELPADILNKQLPYADPVTSQITGQTTSLGTLAAYNDFNHAATRRESADAIVGAVRAIVDAVKQADSDDAGDVAEAAFEAFKKKFESIELNVSVSSNIKVEADEITSPTLPQ